MNEATLKEREDARMRFLAVWTGGVIPAHPAGNGAGGTSADLGLLFVPRLPRPQSTTCFLNIYCYLDPIT